VLKFFLVGWVCIGTGLDTQCVRMGSEVIFDTYQECNEYYQLARSDLSNLKDTELKFTCVQAGLLEDVL
jgi:hypothetical protein